MVDPNQPNEGQQDAPPTDTRTDPTRDFKDRDLSGGDLTGGHPSPKPTRKWSRNAVIFGLIIALGPLAVLTLGRRAEEGAAPPPEPPVQALSTPAQAPDPATGALAAAASAPAPAGGVLAEKTVVDIANERDDRLTLFQQAMERAGSEGLLNGTGPFTVFAPTNEAFQRMSEAGSTGTASGDEMLRQLIKNHVVQGRYTAADLAQRGQLQSLGGKTIPIQSGSGIAVAGARIVEGDLLATNGVVHIVDSVLF